MGQSSDISPTAEQQAIVERSMSGDSLKIEAGAGAGKSTTLKLVSGDLLRVNNRRRILYLAFNTTVAREASGKMPGVVCRTGHSLAYSHTPDFLRKRIVESGATIWNDWKNRIAGSEDLSRQFGDVVYAWKSILDSRGNDADLDQIRRNVFGVLRTVIAQFERSAEVKFTDNHFPWREKSFLQFAGMEGVLFPKIPEEARIRSVKGLVRSSIVRPIVSLADTLWRESIDPASTLPITHDTYLKLFSLGKPSLPFDTILFDEAQDANPVLLSIVESQPVQRIYVGDAHQQIYSWRGAENAMQGLALPKLPLYQSFRFGSDLADYANRILAVKWEFEPYQGSEPMRLRGNPGLKTFVHTGLRTGETDAILCRTNAGVLDATIQKIDAGEIPFIVGGSKGFTTYLTEAYKLSKGQTSLHPEFSMFPTWEDLSKFAETAEGASYGVVLKMVDKYKDEIPGLVEKVQKSVAPSASEGSVTITTAHKAKGLEWDRIMIHDDARPFVSDRDDGTIVLNEEECNLLYVAVTRARLEAFVGNAEEVLSDSEKLALRVPGLSENYGEDLETVGPGV